MLILMEGLEQVGLGHSTSLLTSFEISQWGATMHLHCLFDPQLLLPYEFRLVGCSEVKWLVHSPENVGEELLSITDIQINKMETENDLSAESLINKEFVMLSEVFELIVFCEKVEIYKSQDLENHILESNTLSQSSEVQYIREYLRKK